MSKENTERNQNKGYIISGYNGIMDLDLTNIHEKFHKEMIELHMQEIKEYKKEQSVLRPKLTYENAVHRVLQQIERDAKLQSERQRAKEKEKEKEYLKRIEYSKKIQ